MLRSRAHSWLLCFLPLLTLRLLLPVGVMPGHGSHGASLVLCSQQGAPAPHPAGGSGTLHADSLCPFAAAAASAPPLTLALFSAVTVASAVAPAARAVHVASSGPPRSQRSRAPPHFF